MATSSMATLPALSPIPLTVECTMVAPASMAARVLAVARPRSLWQWTAMGMVISFFSSEIR